MQQQQGKQQRKSAIIISKAGVTVLSKLESAHTIQMMQQQ
jgi:hypothetical protein